MLIENIISKLYCNHDWQVIHSEFVNVFDNEYDTLPVSHRYVEIQKCSKCSKIRKFKIKY
jgi:hypothetical protein